MNADIKKSIHGRLKNWAKKYDESVENTLYRYAIERFLYRLSQSRYKDQFLLKGAFLFTIWYEVPHRTTRDVDFLNIDPNDLKKLERIFKEVCGLHVEDDGMLFEAETIKVETIMEEATYGGVRVRLIAILDKAKMVIQVDIGHGDVVTPSPLEIELPTLLKMPAPRLKTYPIYTVIAEKLETMILKGLGNSRMKDIYDIWFISNNIELKGEALTKAILNTFRRRKTLVPNQDSMVFSEVFYSNSEKQTQWNAFLRKNKLASEELKLEPVMLSLRHFFNEPLNAINLKDYFTKIWSPKKGWY